MAVRVREMARSTSSSVSGRGMSARASTAQGQAVELLDLADVGHGLAGLAPGHESREARLVVDAERRFGVGDDGCPIETDHVAQQQLGIQSRRRRPGDPQPVGRRRERLPDGRPSPQPASLKSDSRSAWSVVMSASMSAIQVAVHDTPGRLCRSTPMRWSVTRSCGKL